MIKPGEIKNYLINDGLKKVLQNPAMMAHQPNNKRLEKLYMQPKISALCLVFIKVATSISVAAASVLFLMNYS